MLNHGKESKADGDKVKPGLEYPVLITSMGCVFTKPAKNFWSKVADETGTELHVLIAEDEECQAEKYNISGYPCLVSGPGKKYYGIHFSHAEGKRILVSE